MSPRYPPERHGWKKAPRFSCSAGLGVGKAHVGYRMLSRAPASSSRSYRPHARAGICLRAGEAPSLLDDLSDVSKDRAETSVLLELIAERYQRKSLLMIVNQPVSGWNHVCADSRMTVAAIDRLVHH